MADQDSADRDAAAEIGSDQPPGETSTAMRVLVVSVAVLAVLLLGAAGGLLLGLPGGHGVPASNSVDVGFAQDMSVHHRQAVQMAGWARDHSTDQAVRQIAFDIETSQLGQVGRMEGWLGLWDKPELPASGKYMKWMTGPEAVAHGHGATNPNDPGVDIMPGMYTQQEWQRLRSLSGRELDVMFLQLMLRHHQGGTQMMEYAAKYATNPQVKNLAQSMLLSQGKETQTLRTLLTARGGQPLPPPS
ncbi:DUF305 domain-containing protein [Allokutzneria sp. NRRL B-24872]|uniref:DUF305 domain-containing protein n=1 Tax=Allokutzneria sp. NRRL B-24872 TaxID=1137961 RepID=UPI001FF01C84|nr:DUF305 domain-containing protein [Allokutzneria sp. NRRL B-24872]